MALEQARQERIAALEEIKLQRDRAVSVDHDRLRFYNVLKHGREKVHVEWPDSDNDVVSEEQPF